MVRGRKVATTTINVKLVVEKLLMTLTKVILMKNGQDISIKGYGFKTLVNKKQIAVGVRYPIISWNLKKAQGKGSKDDIIHDLVSLDCHSI